MAESELPYATHEGEMEIMGVKMKVARLNTGQTVIDQASLFAFLQMLADQEETDQVNSAPAIAP